MKSGRTVRPLSRVGRRPVLAALAAVMFLSLGAGPVVAADQVTIRVGYGGPTTMQAYMEEVLKGAEKALPGIRIQPVLYPSYEDLVTMIPMQIAAGTAPDVVWWSEQGLEYVYAGVVEPLDPWIREAGIDLKGFVPAVLQMWTHEGKLYGVPIIAQCSALVANLDLLQRAGIGEIPRSLAELREAAAKVRQTTDAVPVLLFVNPFHISQYVVAFGGGWGFGRTIDTEANRQALEFLLDLAREGLLATTRDLGVNWDGEAFAKGDVAFSTGGPWYIGYMAEAGPRVRYRLVPFPSTRPGQPSIFTYGGAYSVLKSSQHKREAVAVIRYLTRDEAYRLLYTTALKYTPAKTAFIDEYIRQLPEFQPLREAFLSGVPFDYPIQTKQFGDDLVKGFEQLLYRPGSLAVKGLLASLQSKYGR